ncbi:MAG TPA: DUF5658 family protein [Mobilitalea sp.]|nr:DUF5658 family protein [Mobilitalea sp.]
MITFIKCHNLVSIRKKLILLYLLNVTDILFTLVLLKTGFFSEVNIFMVNAVKNPALSLLLKIVFPAFLLYYLYKRICSSDCSQLKATNIGINISLSIYVLVNISHLVWVAMLPVFYSY